jgi:hypothetical protein
MCVRTLHLQRTCAIRQLQDLQTIEIKNRHRASDAGPANSVNQFHKFRVNNVLKNATQQDVFDACVKDIADATLEGVSGAVLAYGQTGAGL